MIEYDSRRTGNGLLDTGSTPVWSIMNPSIYAGLDKAIFCWYSKRYSTVSEKLKKGMLYKCLSQCQR